MVPNNYTLGVSISSSQGVVTTHPPQEDVFKKAQEDHGLSKEKMYGGSGNFAARKRPELSNWSISSIKIDIENHIYCIYNFVYYFDSEKHIGKHL